ncbi:MAG: ABC transporter, partial [Acidimicrobiia bacterium]|nr:ABC transporter [Acidimicrobiia bacterium]
STGTRRVVDLACLLAHEPDVVLLDEPAAGIAQREVEALAPLLRRLRDEAGASLVVIEHDVPLVEAVADRIIALDQGRVLADGPPGEVLAHPDVVASYLGTRQRELSDGPA